MSVKQLFKNRRFWGGLLLLVIVSCVSPAAAYQLSGPKWPQPTTTFYVDIPGENGLWNTAFEQSMFDWGVGTVFQYKIVSATYSDPCNSSDTHNGVGFATTFCGDAWGTGVLAMAFTQWNLGPSIFTQCDIVFNQNEPWDVYSTPWQNGVDDFHRVAVHELGHALGLAHEDSGVSTIMNSFVDNDTIPQADDKNGVAAIYGAAAEVYFTLSISKAGTGIGTITSSPVGINCGTDCSESYTSGTTVTLTATPQSGSTFAGWSNACTNSSGTCQVILTAAKGVTATFSANASPPDAPTIGPAMAGIAQAKVAFIPPTSNGGSAITGYTATSSPGGKTAFSTTSPITVSGLSNGTAYTFIVTASNSVGNSAPSAPSNSVIPANVPDTPSIISATPGNTSAKIAFTPPASNGGSAITKYTATSSPGGKTAFSTTSPITVSGLSNGTAYTFTVTATNSVGNSAPSAPSKSVIPATVPDIPGIVSATPGNTSAKVTFTTPASNGGSAITGYTATSSPGGKTAFSTISPITVSGLSNGTAYTFTVTASNSVGNSAPSASSISVTPANVPGKPGIGLATRGNARASVSFTPPTDTGGSAITGYTVTSSPGGKTASDVASPITVSGLTNGLAYTFTVKATNAVGSGLASAPSKSVIPATVPGQARIGIVTKANASAKVSFMPPIKNGGSIITKYTVTSTPEGKTATGLRSPITVPGLTNGTAYTFTIIAGNAIGYGPPSLPSKSVTPATVPGKPDAVTASRGNASAVVAFTPPAETGGSVITKYTVSSTPGIMTKTGLASPLTVSGLTNGTAYTFTARAFNVMGAGLASAKSNSVTPATVPGIPRSVTITKAKASAKVAFLPPSSNGGSKITGYTVTALSLIPGGSKTETAAGTASPITIGGLTIGKYTFTVTATNAVGAGQASAPSVPVLIDSL